MPESATPASFRGGHDIDNGIAPPGRARTYLLLACGTAVTLTFGLHAVAPALPLIQETFRLDDFQVGLVTSAYVLPGVLFVIPLGIAADLFGRRRVFATAGVLYGLMGVAQGLAPSFEWLIAWRLLQGVAFAALMPLTVTVIGDAFPGIAQVRAQARRQVSMAAANLVVPIIGAQLAAVMWSLPFMAQSVVIVPALLGLVILDGRPAASAPRRAYVGLALRSIRQPGFPSVLWLGFARFFARFSVLAYLPLHLTRRVDASLTDIGFIMAIATGLGFASALIAPRLAARLRPSTIVTFSLSAVGLALIGFAIPSAKFAMVPVAILFALADGLIAVLQSAYAARGTPDEVRAGLVAVNGMARNGGKFVAPIVTGAIASWLGLAPAFVIAGITIMVAALVVTRGLADFDHVLRETSAEADSRQ